MIKIDFNYLIQVTSNAREKNIGLGMGEIELQHKICLQFLSSFYYDKNYEGRQKIIASKNTTF